MSILSTKDVEAEKVACLALLQYQGEYQEYLSIPKEKYIGHCARCNKGKTFSQLKGPLKELCYCFKNLADDVAEELRTVNYIEFQKNAHPEAVRINPDYLTYANLSDVSVDSFLKYIKQRYRK